MATNKIDIKKQTKIKCGNKTQAKGSKTTKTKTKKNSFSFFPRSGTAPETSDSVTSVLP